MALQMTRQQYEATYVVAPYFSSVTDLDITSAPIRMTRAEYNTKYGPEPKDEFGGILGPAKEALIGLKTLYGGSEQGIVRKLMKDVKEGATDIAQGNVL